MKYLNGKSKSTSATLNLQNRNNNNNNNNNNEVSVITKTFLNCNTCGKSIQKNPILCYIFIDYFCSEKCHDQKHKLNLKNLKKINEVN
jgi:hypothetical protein